jgi:hypothetical protein
VIVPAEADLEAEAVIESVARVLLDHDPSLGSEAAREQLNALFPFGFLLDRSGRIVLVGRSLDKLVFCVDIGGDFGSCFEVLSPTIGVSNNGLDSLLGEIVVLHAKNAPKSTSMVVVSHVSALAPLIVQDTTSVLFFCNAKVCVMPAPGAVLHPT